MSAESDIDLIVLERFFGEKPTGVIVEVGAARPDYLSISAGFRKRGWKVIAIEPNPEFCAAHRAQGHEVLQYACSDEESDDAPFFVVDSHGREYMDGEVSFESFSSLGIKDKFADLHENFKDRTHVTEIRVPVRRLETILAQHEPQLSAYDVLAVDVEGWELNVLRGAALDRFRPSVVILENLFSDRLYRDFMRASGFARWKTLKPNEIYVRRDLAPWWLGWLGR